MAEKIDSLTKMFEMKEKENQKLQERIAQLENKNPYDTMNYRGLSTHSESLPPATSNSMKLYSQMPPPSTIPTRYLPGSFYIQQDYRVVDNTPFGFIKLKPSNIREY